MANNNRRRVVVTGLGAVTPLGLTVDEFWRGCIEGRCGIDFVTRIDTSTYPIKVSGEVRGFDPEQYLERKEARRMALFSQFAVAAASQAMAQAGLDGGAPDPERIGVLLGNGNGGYPNTDEAMRTIIERGGMRVDPFYMIKALPNMAASHLSMRFQARGYISTITTACAAGTQAIGEAMEVIRRGHADVMITGGTEAGMSELGMAAFAVMRVLSPNPDPASASRPFDANRDGFVCSEGAGVLVLEELAHARARGAAILGEVIGFGASADAHHVVAPPEDGSGAARAMRWALDDAGLAPGDVDYINAHGTSTPLNDAAETLAIKSVFNSNAYKVPVSSVKSMIGHGLGAAGGMESVICIRVLQEGVIPPTVNYETPDPVCDLDYVPQKARKVQVRHILKNSFGFGGQNACLVFKRYEE